ncbi:ester cyclase [Stappia sp. WLB 29]|uniref:ester cyclase n=1 Tax=Stappia sp. WLB 29 TaxID=2925220 RepID=UPI0020C17D45|nr:ester cyclase [Stappia sp. WLB 29]
MPSSDLAAIYRRYIDCLNRQDWDELHRYVADDVRHNGRPLGLSGYRQMLVEDFRAIPDLAFRIEHLVCDPPMVASRLWFDCTPVGMLFGLAVNGRRVQFAENVFYEFNDAGRIRNVWSVIDTAAVAAQIADAGLN